MAKPRGEKSMLFSPRPCAKRMRCHVRSPVFAARMPHAAPAPQSERAGRIGASGPPACRRSYSAVPFVASMDSLTSRSSSCFVKPFSSTGMSMRYEFSVAFTCGERFA